MINPMKYKYLVAIMTADKKAYDITQFVEDVSWEEGENQLAARISSSAKNDKTSKGRISSLAKPGCYAALLYSYNGGKNAEATRGKIVEWNPSARTSGEKFKVKAYDVLYDLQESQDHVYFSAGVKTKSAIVQVLKRWGIKVTSYSGPNYIVISATHDVDKMLMTLGLKKAPAAKKSSGNKKTKAKSYDVGDIVNFHGGKHYVSSYPDARGYSVGAGKAKITIKGGSGKAHPWHLVTQNWNQTHVWGWVDDGSFD